MATREGAGPEDQVAHESQPRAQEIRIRGRGGVGAWEGPGTSWERDLILEGWNFQPNGC